MYGTNVTNKLQFTVIYNTSVAIGTVWSGGGPRRPAGRPGRQESAQISPPPATSQGLWTAANNHNFP